MVRGSKVVSQGARQGDGSSGSPAGRYARGTVPLSRERSGVANPSAKITLMYLIRVIGVYEDTIAAVATPLGEAGVGIIKISGAQAETIARRVVKRKDYEGVAWKEWQSHRMYLGYVYEGAAEEIVDEVLFCCMRAPRTYTKEDVVEINCHGGLVSLRKTLELVLAAGARMAEPGEFSKRAFLNGRLDLAQAEAVIDLVRSKTEKGLSMAVSQLRGRLSAKIRELQEGILALLAAIEVENDFPEEGPEEQKTEKWLLLGEELIAGLEELINDAQKGIIYREGVKAAIIGRPNVGKSSLFNALLRQGRAIVTEIPGTTRDTIEERVNIKGIPVAFIDTAGLRETRDKVEMIGVQRTREVVDRSDLVLVVFDAAKPLDLAEREIIETVTGKKLVMVINKTDLGDPDDLVKEVRGLAVDVPVVAVSALTGDGIEKLEERISEKLTFSDNSFDQELLISNTRHRRAVTRAKEHLEEARLGLNSGIPVDIAAIDIRSAWEALGEITGAVVTEDLLDRIFSDFCVGK